MADTNFKEMIKKDDLLDLLSGRYIKELASGDIKSARLEILNKFKSEKSKCNNIECKREYQKKINCMIDAIAKYS